MSALLLALAASAAYGASDFVAAQTAKRLAVVLLSLWSQAIGAVLVVAVVVVSRQGASAAGFAWGAAAGAVGAIGLLLYYRALAIGPTSVVAPLAAAGVAVPVVAGILGGDPPGPTTLVGLGLVLLGLTLALLASQAEPGDPAPAPAPACQGARRVASPAPAPATGPPARAVPLAIAAAVAFGAFFLVLERGTTAAAAAPLWVSLGVEAGALPPTLAALLVLRRGDGVPRLPTPLLGAVAAIAGLNIVADSTLTYATAAGELAVVGVLSSLGPVVTVALAQAVTMERFSRRQVPGVALALVGTLLVASGR